MLRGDVLDTAKKLICGDREDSYGAVKDNFTLIANLWSLWLEARFGVHVPVGAEDVSVMMQQVKQARLANDITHKDSWIDGIGYGALGAEIATGE